MDFQSLSTVNATSYVVIVRTAGGVTDGEIVCRTCLMLQRKEQQGIVKTVEGASLRTATTRSLVKVHNKVYLKAQR